MTDHTRIVALVENGINTTTDIAERMDLNRGHVNKVLLELVEAGRLTRRREGRSYAYYVPEHAPDGVESDDEDGDRKSEPVTLADVMAERADQLRAESDPSQYGVFKNGQRVNRDLDWDFHIPSPTEYIPADGEYDEIEAEVAAREVYDESLTIRLVGPTGAAKTTLAEAMAYENGWPAFTIQASYSLSDADIIGHPTGIKTSEDEAPPFEYGPASLALMSSAEQPTVLIIDEVNRAPPRAKGALMRVLDHRATVEIPFTGETIRGNPTNLIVFSTMNSGANYHVEQIDLAEGRRLGGTWDIPYLGTVHPEREVALVLQRAPINRDLATKLVQFANHIREDVANDAGSKYKEGLPTPNVIEWARTAANLQVRGLDQPVVRAGRAKVVKNFYALINQNAAAEVENDIKDWFKGMTVEPPQSAAAADTDEDEPDDGADDTVVEGDSICVSCGWAGTRDEAEEENWTCPNCGDDLEVVA